MVPFNKYSLLVIASLVLGACSQTYGVTCPQLYSYTEEELLTAAAELSKADIEVVEKMIADYGNTRDAIRACQSYQSRQ